MKKIGVALCTYNGEDFLKEQLDSILQQTVAVDEIIICDDKSTDKTLEILEEYRIENPTVFKIFKNEITLRSVKNFEKAVSLSTADFIFLSDQDDVWHPDKVEKTLSFFDNNPDIDAVFTNANFIDEKSNDLASSLWDSIYFDSNRFGFDQLYEYIIKKRNVVTGATFCFKKEVKSHVLPFPERSNFHHDHWMAFLIAQKNKLGYINSSLISYRLHKKQQVGSVIQHSAFKKFKNKQIDAVLFKRKKSILFKIKSKKILSGNLKIYTDLQSICQQHQTEISQVISELKLALKQLK